MDAPGPYRPLRPRHARAPTGAALLSLLAAIPLPLYPGPADAADTLRSQDGRERLRVIARGKSDAIVSQRGEKVGYCAPRGAQRRCEAKVGGERIVWWSEGR